MPTYSFYLLDSAGTTYDYLVAICPTDQAAREKATRLIPGSSGVEVWRAKRLVGRIAAPAMAVAPMRARDAVEQWFERQSSSAAAPAPV